MELTSVQQAAKQRLLNRFRLEQDKTKIENASKPASYESIISKVASATTGFRASE